MDMKLMLLLMLLLAACTSPLETSANNEAQEPELAAYRTEVVEEVSEVEEIIVEDIIEDVPELSKETIEEEVIEEEIVEVIPQLINGKTLLDRMDNAYDNLHEVGSSDIILEDFPDLVLVYTDEAEDSVFPKDILPFHYYYSEEADTTFNLCSIGRSVFICEGKMDRAITLEDIDSGKCTVTEIYLEDTRIGGSGNMNDGY